MALTDAERRQRLQELGQMEEFLEKGLLSGTITKRIYHKGLVALAHDLIVDHQMLVAATDIIRKCDPKYFEDDQREDMRADPGYAEVVIGLAKALVEQGLIDTRPMPKYTQPLAKA